MYVFNLGETYTEGLCTVQVEQYASIVYAILIALFTNLKCTADICPCMYIQICLSKLLHSIKPKQFATKLQ